MKLSVGTILFKIPLLVIGLVVVCLVAAFVLTDPAPSTLPRRARRLAGEIAAIVTARRGPLPLPPLVDVPVVSIPEARALVADESYVVGLELGGETRAYPLNMLSRPDHHVVDDVLGGRPVAVTWCGLCQSAIVYDRTVDGKTLTLFVSGELHGENMVLRDVETGSDWPQMMGEAVKGPLRGKGLVQIASVWTDWKSWRDQHPQTTLMNIPQTVDYYRHDVDSARSLADNRYFSNLQWGLVRDGRALSWPVRELAKRSVVNDSFAGLPFVVIFDRTTVTIAAFDRRIGETELTFQRGTDGLPVDDQTATVWDPVSGRGLRGKWALRRLKPVAGVISHLRAWRTSHPETLVRTIDAS
jgi:hypothetical protein